MIFDNYQKKNSQRITDFLAPSKAQITLLQITIRRHSIESNWGEENGRFRVAKFRRYSRYRCAWTAANERWSKVEQKVRNP